MSVRSSGFAQGVIAACLVGMAMSVQAAEWPGGSSFTIPAGTSVTNATAQPSISCFTNNGTLTFLPGAEVTLTGSVITAIGSGMDASGVFECLGGKLVHQGSGYFVVGHAGAVGSMTIAAGAEVRMPPGRFCIAHNGVAWRERPARGDVSVAGLLSADIIELTGYFPTNLAPPYVLSATLALEEGGVVEAGLIGKHDCARSEIRFNGGTLRTLKDTTSLFTGQGIVDLVIADNTGAVFDTNGKTAVITPGVSPGSVCLRGQTNAAAIGNGGLVKKGEGMLAFQLPPSCNTFTGAVTVNEGVLILNNAAGTALADAVDVNVNNAFGRGSTVQLNFNETIDHLSGNIGATVSLGSNTLTIGASNGAATFNGTITGTPSCCSSPEPLLNRMTLPSGIGQTEKL